MCLALVACEENKKPVTSIDDSKQEVDHQTSSAIYGASESQYANHPYLEEVFGTWKFKENFASSKYKMYKTLTLNGDGTCVIDGENANWKIEDEETNEASLYIGLYKNSELVYAASFQNEDQYGLTLWPVFWQGGAYAQPNNYVLFIKKNA